MHTPAAVDNMDTDLGQETLSIGISNALVYDWQLQNIATFDELKKRMANNKRKIEKGSDVSIIGNLTATKLSAASKKINGLLQSEVFIA